MKHLLLLLALLTPGLYADDLEEKVKMMAKIGSVEEAALRGDSPK